MPSKSLKASVNVSVDQVEDAIVFLSDRYLKVTKTTCRTIQTPTNFCLVDLCKPLIEGWISGKVDYAKGKITLLFRSGELSDEADMIIYAPIQGDRFLYTKPRQVQLTDDQLSLSFEASSGSPANSLTDQSVLSLQQLSTRQEVLEQKLLQITSDTASNTQPSSSTEKESDDVDPSRNSQSSNIFTFDQLPQQFKDQLTQHIRDNLTAALQQINHHVTDLREQITELSERLDELEDLSLDDDDLPSPQSRNEWLERIEQTWGTVGDYERYNAAYRDANAETPLHETPDWVALCELEWARELCPALVALYSLIHSADGIGYEGADILQQFGQHIDPKTGDSYYIYRHSGFTAFEALQQIIYSPDYSWLPDLKKLWFRLGSPDHAVFQMFGWEEEAIAALKSVATQTQNSQRSGYSWDYRQAWQAASQNASIKEYRAVLNLGPFTPVTIEGLKRAYREAMKTAHPDSGGDTESAQRINEAYEAVMRHYFPEAT